MNDIITILLIVLLSVLLVAVVIITFILVRRSRFNKAVKDINEKAEYISKYVKESVLNLINRFYLISQRNEKYVDIYNNFNERLEMIVNTYDDALKEKVANTQDLLNQHKKKQAKIALFKAKECYEDYAREIKALEESMGEYLNEDDRCHDEAIPYQRRYREAKDNYNAHKDELSLIDDSIQKVFGLMENLFGEFEKYSSGAHYEEASAQLTKINRALNELEDGLKNLPMLCSRISYILPQRIKEIQDQYALMDKEKYPLHHLKVNTTLESVQNKMQELTKLLSRFSYKNVDVEINVLEETLKNLKENFDKEVTSRAYVDENQKKAMQEEFYIEKRFMRLKKVLPDYKKIYWVQEKYLESMNELQEGISNLEKMKRELEGNMLTAYMQPYTVIMTHLKDLQKEIEKMDNLLIDYDNYLKSLKIDSENAYAFLREKFILLKKLEKDLGEMNIPLYSNTKKGTIAQCYGYLENIGMFIKIRPINVESINASVSKADELITRLTLEIEEKMKKMHDAEDAIVYANRYRQAFNDVRHALARAEDAFIVGDFVTTLDEAVSVCLKMKPSSEE